MGVPGYISFCSPGAASVVSGRALWNWDITNPNEPVVKSYSGNKATKTGLGVTDLQQAAGVPLVYYNTDPPTPVPAPQLLDWIRDAEDWVEQETGLLLTPTWIASPPEIQPYAALSTGTPVASGGWGGQRQGIDYDLADAGYDFIFDRAQDDGWVVQPLRYRPIRNVHVSAADFTAVKNMAGIYPLLSDFFRVPPTWFVEDQDYGMLRIVPAENVQMLPMFAMQLALMGFAESVPGAWHFQYTAGLTATDYSSRFRFIKRLVVLDAAMRALNSIQSTVNMGLLRTSVLVDGMQTQLQYPEQGAFGAQITAFSKERDSLMHTAQTKVMGPSLLTL
jgi:hypothetical protein